VALRLQELICHYLAVCNAHYKVAQRKVASQVASRALSSGSSTTPGTELQHISLAAASLSMRLSSHLDHDLDDLFNGSGHPPGAASGKGLPDGAAVDDAMHAAAAAAAAAVIATASASSSNVCCLSGTAAGAAHAAGSEADRWQLHEQWPEYPISLKSLQPSDAQSKLAMQNSKHIVSAFLQPHRLQQFLSFLPDLLAPQRLAVGLALLDGALQIGQHEVAVGHSCKLESHWSTAGRQRWLLESLARHVAAAFVALLKVLPGHLQHVAVAAAADTVGAAAGKQQLLHVMDIGLALLAVDQARQSSQQQELSEHRTANVQVAKAASRVKAVALAVAQLSTAVAATATFALTKTRPVCQPAVSAGGSSAASAGTVEQGPVIMGSPWRPQSGSSRFSANLLTTVVHLHVALFVDLLRLWWAYHANVALRLPGRLTR
jgi:hypothetical protein